MESREALATFIRWVMRDTRYHAQYSAVVQRQHDDDSLDLLPDDDSVRGTGLSNVGIRHGLPGVRVRVQVGSRVLLGFEGGKPSAPYAALWDASAIESIAFNGGEASVARVGDACAVFWPPSMTFAGASITPPLTITGTVTITSPGVAIIESGSDKVRA